MRGRRLVAAADVVVVDRLAPRDLLDELPDDVEVIDCGKSAHRHNLTPGRDQRGAGRPGTRRASGWSGSRAATRSCSAAAARSGWRASRPAVPVTVVPGISFGACRAGGGGHPADPPRCRRGLHRHLGPPRSRAPGRPGHRLAGPGRARRHAGAADGHGPAGPDHRGADRARPRGRRRRPPWSTARRCRGSGWCARRCATSPRRCAGDGIGAPAVVVIGRGRRSAGTLTGRRRRALAEPSFECVVFRTVVRRQEACRHGDGTVDDHRSGRRSQGHRHQGRPTSGPVAAAPPRSGLPSSATALLGAGADRAGRGRDGRTTRVSVSGCAHLAALRIAAALFAERGRPAGRGAG